MNEDKDESLKRQVGGSHYKDLPVQPAEYVYRNGLGYHEGSIVYYATRWRMKNGIEDLEKIAHHAQILIDLAKKYPPKEGPK